MWNVHFPWVVTLPTESQFLPLWPHTRIPPGGSIEFSSVKNSHNTLCYIQYKSSVRWWNNMQKVSNVFLDVHHVQGPPGQKGDQGATEIIDYNGNIQEALQVWQVFTYSNAAYFPHCCCFRVQGGLLYSLVCKLWISSVNGGWAF